MFFCRSCEHLNLSLALVFFIRFPSTLVTPKFPSMRQKTYPPWGKTSQAQGGRLVSCPGLNHRCGHCRTADVWHGACRGAEVLELEKTKKSDPSPWGDGCFPDLLGLSNVHLWKIAWTWIGTWTLKCVVTCQSAGFHALKTQKPHWDLSMGYMGWSCQRFTGSGGIPIAWLWNITRLRDGIYHQTQCASLLPQQTLRQLMFCPPKNLQGTSRTGTKRKQRKPQNLALTVWMPAFQMPGAQRLLMHVHAWKRTQCINSMCEEVKGCWKLGFDLLQIKRPLAFHVWIRMQLNLEYFLAPTVLPTIWAFDHPGYSWTGPVPSWMPTVSVLSVTLEIIFLVPCRAVRSTCLFSLC